MFFSSSITSFSYRQKYYTKLLEVNQVFNLLNYRREIKLLTGLSYKKEEIVMLHNKPYSKKVILRYHILTLAANFRITLKQAAKELKLSYRQTLRLFRRFIDGKRKITSLISKKVAWNKLNKSDHKKVIEICQKYPDFNNCHLADIFQEETGHRISHETIRNIRIDTTSTNPT